MSSKVIEFIIRFPIIFLIGALLMFIYGLNTNDATVFRLAWILMFMGIVLQIIAIKRRDIKEASK